MTAMDPAALETLLKQVSQKQLSQHPYWLRLLHYHKPWESPGQWSFRSDVQNPAFFLSPLGQTDPHAELQATLRAFFEPDNEDPNLHPQCRFVARFQWLRTQLDLLKSKTQKACPMFEQWANLSHVRSISLVFASAYMGNPASIYGHILLKINSEGDVFAHSLLSPTFNFGAALDGADNPLVYAFKGLFGGYTGRLSDERFYNYNHIYGESELRDLWEYELNLDEQQRRRIIYHAWELLQAVDFDYYFFLDNCAYRLAGLLEMAWDEKRINPEFSLWTIPINVFFHVNAMENNGAPLVKSVQLHPSRQRRLLKKAEGLNSSQKFWLSQIVHQFEKIHSPEFKQLAGDEQAEVLDALIDYNQYQAAEEQTLLSAEQKSRLLLRRSQLPILPEALNEFASLAPPTEGTPPVRFRIGGVYNSEQLNALEVAAWTSFHDSLGREDGHLPHSELITLDTRVRLTEEQIYLHQLIFFNLRSIDIAPIDSPLSSAWSWQATGTLEPRDLSCEKCPVLNLTGGIGKAESIFNSGFYSLFLSSFVRASNEYEQDYTLGVAPSLGIVLSPLEIWKFEFTWTYLGAFLGERISEHQLQWKHRLTLTDNTDARLEIMHHKGTEAGLFFNYYW
ncbi:MAG: DUF4105 domain-containing protein [SAR324 cluster bacterium]|nr:DUF4105 domain-containing protein [SAR324 cluster bacterium]